jgi:cyclic pyranopterin phosphate synthase
MVSLLPPARVPTRPADTPDPDPFAPLVDTYGRVVSDLRVSLTDKCSLRCTYCMPAEGLPWLPREELLTDDEIVRLVQVALRLGVTSVRLTGGEPLLRPGTPDLIGRLAGLTPRPELSLTTNGLLLRRDAKALATAGLTRVNVSLDTVDPDRFYKITHRNRHHDVLDGLAAAAEAGLDPIKINAVLLRGINDDEAPTLLAWALENGYQLRFIEQMPLDAQHGWHRSQMVTAAEILESLQAAYDLRPVPTRGSDPAERWTVHSGPHPGTVGVIGSVTRPFCGACDRIRLTADGQIRNCLFATEESDLRAPLRAGAPDESLAAQIRRAVTRKLPGHGINNPDFLQPTRPMSAIGG